VAEEEEELEEEKDIMFAFCVQRIVRWLEKCDVGLISCQCYDENYGGIWRFEKLERCLS